MYISLQSYNTLQKRIKTAFHKHFCRSVVSLLPDFRFVLDQSGCGHGVNKISILWSSPWRQNRRNAISIMTFWLIARLIVGLVRWPSSRELCVWPASHQKRASQNIQTATFIACFCFFNLIYMPGSQKQSRSFYDPTWRPSSWTLEKQ